MLPKEAGEKREAYMSNLNTSKFPKGMDLFLTRKSRDDTKANIYTCRTITCIIRGGVEKCLD